MSEGHIHAARATAQVFACEPDLPPKVARAFEHIAEVLAMHIREQVVMAVEVEHDANQYPHRTERTDR